MSWVDLATLPSLYSISDCIALPANNTDRPKRTVWTKSPDVSFMLKIIQVYLHNWAPVLKLNWLWMTLLIILKIQEWQNMPALTDFNNEVTTYPLFSWEFLWNKPHEAAGRAHLPQRTTLNEVHAVCFIRDITIFVNKWTPICLNILFYEARQMLPHSSCWRSRYRNLLFSL